MDFFTKIFQQVAKKNTADWECDNKAQNMENMSGQIYPRFVVGKWLLDWTALDQLAYDQLASPFVIKPLWNRIQ